MILPFIWIKGISPVSVSYTHLLLKLLDRHNEEMKTRVGVDRAPTTMSTYVYTRRTLAEFIKTEFKVSDLSLIHICISIGGAGVTGEKEEVPGDDM